VRSAFSETRCKHQLSTRREHISTHQENTDAAVRHLYVRISVIKANYKNNITL